MPRSFCHPLACLLAFQAALPAIGDSQQPLHPPKPTPEQGLAYPYQPLEFRAGAGRELEEEAAVTEESEGAAESESGSKEAKPMETSSEAGEEEATSAGRGEEEGVEGGLEDEAGGEREAGGEGEGEGEGGEGEGEGLETYEGEEHFSEADVEVAKMLLGSVSFVMGMQYLVNWSDDDIRRYSWKIISTTNSIFLSVLLFQGFNQVLLLWVSRYGEFSVSLFQFLHCFVYILALQLTIGYISGAILEKQEVDLNKEVWVINDPLRKDNNEEISESKVRNSAKTRSAFIDEYGMEVPCMKVRKELETRTRWMKCYARLLAHMAGFACINSGGTMQNLSIFKQRPSLALIPIAITQLSISVVFKCFGYHRAKLQDGGMRAKMYHEEVFEAENDISSLSSSFLVVNVLRFAISGILPDCYGDEHPKRHHTMFEIIVLYGFGLVFAMLSVAMALIIARSKRGGEEEEGDEEDEEASSTGLDRVMQVGLNAATMAFAWCVLWSSRWWSYNFKALHEESTLGKVVLALLLSAVACVAVFALDWIDDHMHSSQGADTAAKVIQVVINALGILIGFSWEHCFDSGVTAVACETSHPARVKFLMGFIITGVMTPMWQKHILTKEMALQKLKSDRHKMEVRLSRSSHEVNDNVNNHYIGLAQEKP